MSGDVAIIGKKESADSATISSSQKGGKRRMSQEEALPKITLDIQHASYRIGGKPILRDVAFQCKTGELMGVLGPSGSGKTVLLDLLTFSASNPAKIGSLLGPSEKQAKETVAKYGMPDDGFYNLLQANIMFGDEKIENLKTFSKFCAYVPTLDAQYPTLTCKQVLMYTSKILSGDTEQECDERVEALLDLLGLQVCKNTVVGGYVGLKGMSGGQKKRLAIGLALLREPKVLYLDEPTSGLDSAASYHVMKMLGEIARKMNLVVISTLQQPPASVYEICDRVLLMSEGSVIYAGSRLASFEYLQSLKLPCPIEVNPADHMLTLVNSALGEDKRADKGLPPVETLRLRWIKERNKKGSDLKRPLTDPAAAQGTKKGTKETRAVYERAMKALPRKKLQTRCGRLKNLLRREFRVAFTDPVLYLFRPIMYFGANAFMSCLWWEGREPDNKFIVAQVWKVFMSLTANSCFSIVCVYFFFNTFPIVSQEIRNGYYRASEYVLSIILISLPVHFICALASCYGSIYGMGGYNFEVSYYGVITSFLLMQIFDGAARALSCAPILIIAFGGFIQYWFSSFLFCGMFLDPEKVLGPIKIFAYISPHRHAFPIWFFTEFNSRDNWKNSSPCPPGGEVSPSNGCMYHDGVALVNGKAIGIGDGFTCGPQGSYRFQCYGNTGMQVLTTLKKVFFGITNKEDDVPIHLIALAGIGFVFISIHALWFCEKVYASAKVFWYDENSKVKESSEDDAALVAGRPGTNSGSRATNSSLAAIAEGGEENEDEEDVFGGESTGNDCDSYAIVTKMSGGRLIEVAMPTKGVNKRSSLAQTAFSASNTNCFACVDLDVWIKKGGKKLVQKACMQASGGQVFALLGPSGAGKTTFLDGITFNLSPNLAMSGQVWVRGQEVYSLKGLQKHCVYVPQYIQLIPTLSCRENLEVTARLVTPMSADREYVITTKVQEMLDTMGLMPCAEEKAGGVLGNTGMTPGQKKRLSVALGLLKAPAVLFLDEPTTGLDAASAYLMMYFLKKTAIAKNIVVILTLHQPSNDIWAMCDRVMIMARGETVFCGASDAALGKSSRRDSVSALRRKNVNIDTSLRDQLMKLHGNLPQTTENDSDSDSDEESFEGETGNYEVAVPQEATDDKAKEVLPAPPQEENTEEATVEIEGVGEQPAEATVEIEGEHEHNLTDGNSSSANGSSITDGGSNVGVPLSTGLEIVPLSMEEYVLEPNLGVDDAVHHLLNAERLNIPAIDSVIKVIIDRMQADRTMQKEGRHEVEKQEPEEDIETIETIEKFFESKVELPVPVGVNPADHFLDVVNADFASPEQQRMVLDKWKEHRAQKLRDSVYTNVQILRSQPLIEDKKHVPFFVLFFTLLKREIKVACFRDPTPYIGRIVLYFISSCFFDLAYAGHWDMNQENAMTKCWLCCWHFVANPLFSASATVYLNQALKLVRGEIRNGYYSPHLYLTVITALAIPMCLILTWTVILIPGYVLGNLYFKPTNLVMSTLNFWTYFVCYEFFAHLASMIKPANLLVGLVMMIIYWYNSFLFCGLMLDIEECWPIFKVFSYPSPTRWGIASQVYIEFMWSDRVIPGAVPCAAGTIPTPENACRFAELGVDANGNTVGLVDGYSCGIGAKTCFGYTGKHVLDTLVSLNFKTFEPVDNVILYLIVMVAIAISSKLGHWYLFLKNVTNSPKLDKVTSKNSMKISPA